MIYLIYGNQIPAIKNRLKRIIKERLDIIDEMTYVRYDGNNVLVQEVVDDANYLPLGYEHKLVALDNCYFLEKPKPRNKIESDQDYQKLKDFISHPSEESDLVLIANTLSIDKNSEIVKLHIGLCSWLRRRHRAELQRRDRRTFALRDAPAG